MLLTAAVLLLTAVCAWNGARRIGVPFPGFLVAYNRTVLSVARPDWPLDQASRALFSQVVAVDGRPVESASEILAAVAALEPGIEVAYRLRKGSELFTERVPVQRFSLGDYVAIYGTYAGVGIAFSLAGLWALWRSRGTRREPVLAFFLLCQSVGTTLGIAGDAYGPYWFTPVYLVAQCLAIANLLHLAASYPYVISAGSRVRRAALAIAYGLALLLALGLGASADDLALFLPLLYVVYLLLANAIVLYAAGLGLALFARADRAPRTGLGVAFAGIVLVFLVSGTIFVVYPVLDRVIPPILLVGPLLLFPVLTAWALVRRPLPTSVPVGRSIRLRLSLLFLGAVETSFLVALVVFWQSNSFERVVARIVLNERQAAAVERVAASPRDAVAQLTEIAESAQTVREAELVDAALRSAQAGDQAALERALDGLREHYVDVERRLEARRQWIGSLDVVVLAALLIVAVLQAVGFMLAIRVWLIRPIERIASATEVIATGDLAHRLQDEQTEEFSALARSVNAMAASLQSIQRRVELARASRQRATGAARDAERRRLARELHDGVLQDLTAARLRLEAAADAEGNLRQSLEAIGGAIATIRHLVDELRPHDLGRTSLAEAIAAHARILTFGRGIDLALELEADGAVPDWAARDIYRIAQEAIANAVRHAGPRRLAVRLRASERETLLEVEDDGSGFEPERVAVASGLASMRERAAALGADLEVSSGIGRGTCVRLLLRLSGGT